jgi:hypothetical protein
MNVTESNGLQNPIIVKETFVFTGRKALDRVREGLEEVPYSCLKDYVLAIASADPGLYVRQNNGVYIIGVKREPVRLLGDALQKFYKQTEDEKLFEEFSGDEDMRSDEKSIAQLVDEVNRPV